jgi:hypothetical protein
LRVRVRLADGVAAGGEYAHVTLATGAGLPGKKPSMTKYKRDVVLGMVTYIPAISLWLPGVLGMQ